MNLPGESSANLLGALALLAGSRMRASVNASIGASGALAEALVVLKDQPGVTAEWLGQVLGLTQPGAAHLVRRLREQGWVERRAGADARSRALHLTPEGASAAARILRARAEALTALLAPLTAEQRSQLDDIARTLLHDEVTDARSLAHLCRLCDRARCPRCPVHAGLQELSAD
ncbi:MarR family winged helix-turn-helix transcriptional regulator [Micromonospora sp. U21]|uniref:MarR family winged helix-turn-helix transcriptional regulator n=1 Tax=Micromonospora sp. U21 TaxID=2824899 RepID=UPI001B395260|nr:MarR family winged helix-turn-helix transcriptional regulator [Micromonospora sp. U21]MBQ0902319.1 winged helix-turn-helix transcriptional regulator [Micromonospora sp. U21]